MKLNRTIAAGLLALYLGTYNGCLALYRQDCPVPEETYPLQVRMLPECDRKNLTNGIPIRDSLHLAQLLEDFLS